MVRRRALQTAETATNGATSTTLPGVARCVSSALANAASGSVEKACDSTTGFSFFQLTGPPTNEQIRAMCAVSACHKTVDAIQKAAPNECQLPNGGSATYLYRDVINPVTTTCKFSRRMDGSASSSSSSSDFPMLDDRSGDVLYPPVQSTESAAPSGLTVGPIVALIGGAIICGFLAAFIRSQLQRRRQDHVKLSEDRFSQPPSNNGGPESIVAPLEEIDEFYSHHAEFTAIAMSSKVSSNPSRASTARSSKHSESSSYTDAELAIVEYSPQQQLHPKGDAFDDPALVMLRIPMSKIHVGQLISLGGYGQVYSGIYDHQLPVAIKTLLPERCLDARKVEMFLGEAKLLARLSHERIERLVGVAWDTSDKDPWMLTEFVGGGDLRELLNQFATERRLVGFSIEKVKIALHVAEALHYLHSLDSGVLHLDLKSRNVLLTPQWDAVVTSIGCQRERDSRPKSGASLWTAPEVIVGERFDEKADIFSFGVLLSEIDTHDLPYAIARDWDDRIPQDTVIHEQVWRGELSVSFSERADPDMVALGTACISVNPRHRPTAHELFERVSHVMQSYGAFV